MFSREKNVKMGNKKLLENSNIHFFSSIFRELETIRENVEKKKHAARVFSAEKNWYDNSSSVQNMY